VKHTIAPISSQKKVPTGIVGLDEVLHGGIPRGRTTVIIGGPGSGKTILALQTLVNGARQRNEPGVFVAFEESAEQIIGNASAFDWDLKGLQKRKLFFLDARTGPDLVKSGDFDLGALLSIVGERARMIGAKRIVFDAVDVLLALLDDPAAQRRELYRLHCWLQESGMTGIITAKADGTFAHGGPRFSGLQFMADTVITLDHELMNGVGLRNLWVMKYRGSGFSENLVPMSIGRGGMEVSAVSRMESQIPVTKRRVSSGVPQLDEMLNGGYFRGSSILITGSPGTSKSTLAGAFVESACSRGERALYVSFDESSPELERNLTSVNIHIRPYLKSGLLRVHSILAEGCSAKEHFNNIRALVEEFRPSCLVLDPLSALIKSGGEEVAQSVSERLINLGKSMGITVFNISLLGSPDKDVEATRLQISTVADTWIHVSYLVLGGERNRALTIVKSRGTRHSNQVRELILSDKGIALADAYQEDGEVLMGTLRWQKEQANLQGEARTQADVTRQRLKIDLASLELTSRLELLKREIKVQQAEMDVLVQTEDKRVGRRANHSAALVRKRGGVGDRRVDRRP
jgi:circadian clock protein KaiC